MLFSLGTKTDLKAPLCSCLWMTLRATPRKKAFSSLKLLHLKLQMWRSPSRQILLEINRIINEPAPANTEEGKNIVSGESIAIATTKTPCCSSLLLLLSLFLDTVTHGFSGKAFVLSCLYSWRMFGLCFPMFVKSFDDIICCCPICLSDDPHLKTFQE